MSDNEGIECRPVTHCSLCGAPGVELHRALRDHLFGAPGIWGYRRCTSRACGAGWLDPRPRSEDLGKLYASYYTHTDVAREPDGDSAAESGSKSLLRTLLARLLPWQADQFASAFNYLAETPPGRILEVGCGGGKFLAEAARRGWAAEGLDFDPKAVETANARAGVKVLLGDVDHPELQDGHYDAVLLNHVIEHVPDPQHVLARCFALLRPGGRIVVITPNMSAHGHRWYGQDWRGLEVPRHLILFTARALKRAGRTAGFAQVQCFSPIGAFELGFIADQSRLIASRAGRIAPDVPIARLRLLTKLKTLVGVHHGEFIVLTARR